MKTINESKDPDGALFDQIFTKCKPEDFMTVLNHALQTDDVQFVKKVAQMFDAQRSLIPSAARVKLAKSQAEAVKKATALNATFLKTLKSQKKEIIHPETVWLLAC